MDRKTFFIGLFLAVVVILAGYYALNRFLAKDGGLRNLMQPNRAPPPPPQANIERSPFVQDAENDQEAMNAMRGTGRGKILMVHAPWCGHCRNMMGAFLQAASMDNSVDWIRADGNNAPSLVKREDMRGFPTVYGIAPDGTVTQHSGPRDAASLMAFAKTVGQTTAPVPVVEKVDLEEEAAVAEVLEEEEKA